MVDVIWACRFHPTDSVHEVRCPHQEWTKEQLLEALITRKRFEQGMINSITVGTPVKLGPCTCAEGGEHHVCPQHGCNCMSGMPQEYVLSSGQAEINTAIAKWSKEDKENHAKVSRRRTET